MEYKIGFTYRELADIMFFLQTSKIEGLDCYKYVDLMDKLRFKMMETKEYINKQND